jgi:Zn-dependent M16 (insulinase) family peptidase
VPSKACGQRIQEADATRTAAQKEKLGEDGCKKHGEILQEAEESNDVDTPEEVTQKFQLPDASKISLIDVSSVKVRSGMAAALAGGDAGTLCERFLPISKKSDFPKPTFQIDHAAGSQFVTCQVLLPTEGLTVQQLDLLPLWFHVMFELPLAASDLGPEMGFEAVVQALTDLTVTKTTDVQTNVILFRLKVEKARYSEAPLWIARILCDAVFDVDRLKVAAKRILNDIPNVKRNGRALMGMAMEAMNFKDESLETAFSAFRTERVLTALVESDDSLQAGSKELAGVRAAILKDASKFYARVAGDVMSLDDVFGPWQRCAVYGSGDCSFEAAVPVLPRDLFASDALRPAAGSTGGCLVTSSAEESNYWQVTCECITDTRSPDLGALMVAMEYCTALEGPFWRKIRGRGLSYSYSMNNNLQKGTIQFGLFKATDPMAAFNVAKEIVLKLCGESSGTEAEPKAADGEEEEEEEEETGMDPSALEGAQSGVLFALFEGVDTIPGALAQPFLCTLNHKRLDQLQWLLGEVQAVTAETAQQALRTHVLPLFTGAKGRIVSMVCPEKKREQLQESLAKADPPFKVTHLEVDDLVKTLAPANGFASLREKARQA